MDPDLVRGRVALEELGVVGQGDIVASIERLEGDGQRHVAVPVVMPVRLPVGRDVRELGPVAIVAEAIGDACREVTPVVEQLLERDRLRDRAVVEE